MTVGYKNFLWFCWRWWRGLLAFPAFPAWVALWRVLRGVSAAPGRVWYLCRACGVGGSTGVLHRFRGVVCCWWCPASRGGVGADPRRLVALSGRGVVGGSSRRLGVVPGLLRGAVTGCGLAVGAGPVQLPRGCDGLVRALLRALVLVVGLASGCCSSAVVAFLGL